MLSRLVGATGGRLFEVRADLDLETVFEEIDSEVRSQYSIGYTPKRDLGLPGFRTIKLDCRRRGLVVRARNAYSPSSSHLAVRSCCEIASLVGGRQLAQAGGHAGMLLP